MLGRLEVQQVIFEVDLAHCAVFVGGDRLLDFCFNNVAEAQVLFFLHVSKASFFDLGSVFLTVLDLSVCCDKIEVLVGIGVDLKDLEA